MSFRKYPEYRNSGASLLGEVPAHWVVSRLKYFGRLITGITPPSEDLNNYSESGWPWVRPDDLSDSGSAVTASKFLTDQGWSHCRSVSPGSTLVCCIGSIGKLGYTKTVTCTNQQITAVEPLRNARYLFYLVYASKSELDLRATGNVLRILNSERLGSVPTAVPPTEEAAQIARFLDHETAKIDALIREQERLIELLQEKRQAVISHAVAKGLDPNAPMKDSGVEWLGEVPAHWQVKPLRYLGECQNGINIAGDAFGSGFPFIGYGHVYKNDVLPSVTNELVQSSQKDRERYSVQRGDVFFTRTSETVDEIGFSATCFHDIHSAVFAGFLIRFRPVAPNLLPEFSRYYFSNQRLREFFNKEMNLVTRASLSQDLLKKMEVTLPPVQEQSSISSQLDQVTGKVDRLIFEARASIELLVERRSSLISAAVTGKIDVRAWQPPKDESAFDEEIRQVGMEATA